MAAILGEMTARLVFCLDPEESASAIIRQGEDDVADSSAIEWTESTWNPVTGCTKVSAGCDNCYAERFSERFRGVPGHPFQFGFDLTLRPERIDQPTRWRRPRLIFVNSMSDLFHKKIPPEFVDQVFETMETANWHVYQVLTKRSSLMRDYINRRYPEGSAPSHIWLGVSIENAAALSRLRHLRQTSATVRFVSFEPLLGAIGATDLSGIHWAIAGGESGPGARPVEIGWLREIRDQCLSRNVAFFFKQWGGRTPKAGGNVLDDRKWLQYPDVGLHERLEIPLRAAGSPTEGNLQPATMEVGPWAREKLECLRKYLKAYTTILSKRNFKGYFYIDAFAGSGSLKIRKDAGDPAQQTLLEVSEHAALDKDETEYLSGSPRVALEVAPPFTDYIFVEVDQVRIQHLESLKSNSAEPGRVHIRKQDCNTCLTEFIEKIRPQKHHWRGVVFFDPFGMQVPWQTIADIGKTGVIEILINFPVGMAIQRLLKRRGEFTPKQKEKLDSYFGTSEWYELLYSRNQGLFGPEVAKVDDSGDVLVRWYRERLKSVFEYVTEAREVQTNSGRPLYYLIFAGPNRTGARIASDILRQGARRIR